MSTARLSWPPCHLSQGAEAGISHFFLTDPYEYKHGAAGAMFAAKVSGFG
jgi:hypothetical protein